MPRVEIRMKISRKRKSTQGIPIYLMILKATRRRRSKKIFNGPYQPEDKKGIDHRLLEDTPLVVRHHLK
jgi:hypothetical protein